MYQENIAMVLGEEQSMLQDSAREFCRCNSDISMVRTLLASETGFDLGVWQEMAELGWMGVAVPEEFGGSGLGIGSAVYLMESMGKYLLSNPFISTALVARAVLQGGSEGQREVVLPAIVGGEIATPALLESEDWGDEDITLSARREGTELLLSGSKRQVAYASSAKLFLVSALVEGTPGLLLVSSAALPDGAIHNEVGIDETRRTARVDFTGVRVKRHHLLPGDASILLRDIKLLGALLYGAEATGSAAACLDLTVEYAKTRKQFGQLIGSYQALKHPLVDVLCEIDRAKSFIYHGASVVGVGELAVDVEIACRMAKAQASNALRFAGDRAVQFHGGIGFTYECDAQLYIRRAQWSAQVFGDAYHHRKRLAPLLLDS